MAMTAQNNFVCAPGELNLSHEQESHRERSRAAGNRGDHIKGILQALNTQWSA
jgi:hypothetical protein